MGDPRNGHQYRQDVKWVRQTYNTCHLCGHPVNPGLPGNHKLGGTLDHIIPVKKGGENRRANSRLAHMRCNSKRGAMTITEWFKQNPVTKPW